MGLKLSVGLQKKVGLPDYGSLGASCHVEFEVDRCLIDENLDGFHQKVAQAFHACQQSVNDELTRQTASSGNEHGTLAKPGPQTPDKPHANRQPSRNGHRNGGGPGPATQSQVRAIFAIARKHQLDVSNVVREWFNVDRPDDLSIREASSLIDQLKTGRVEVRS